MVHRVGMAEYTSQELENPVDRVLVLRVALSSSHRLLPERVVGLLQCTKIGRDGLLVPLDCSNPIDDRVDVHEMAGRDIGEGIGGMTCGIVHVYGDVVGLTVRGLLFALDEAEEVGLAAVEVGVFEVPWLGISVALQDALLQMRNFVKPVHVQLAHKGRELLVLEPASKHLTRKLLMVEYYRTCPLTRIRGKERKWAGVDRRWRMKRDK